VREVAEQLRIVGRVADEHPAFPLGVQVAAEAFAHDPARAAELVVHADPAVDVDGTDGGAEPVLAHQPHDTVDVGFVQPGELAVVDGDVGLAAGAVLRQPRVRQGGQYALRHRLQPHRVRPPCGRVLRVGLAQRAVRPAPERHRVVLGHDGVHRPGQRERLAPAGRPPGDGEHRQAGGAQRVQGGQRVGRDRAVGGQGVVDVGEHAVHVGTRRLRPVGKGKMAHEGAPVSQMRKNGGCVRITAIRGALQRTPDPGRRGA